MTLTTEPPAAPPWPYPPARPPRSRSRVIASRLATGLAIVTAALIALAFLAYLIAPASTFAPPGATTPGESAETWPADLDAFSALIGTGPASGDAWDGGVCQPARLGATGERTTVACLEPDGVAVFVSDYSSPANVHNLVSGEVASGGRSSTWTVGGQVLGGTVTSTANGDTTVTTTLDGHPSVLVTVMGSDLNTVTADSQSAPLPH